MAEKSIPAILGIKKIPWRLIFKKSETQLEAFHKKNVRTQEIKNTMETIISPSHELILSLLREDDTAILLV
jgi:hypothetical protein